MQKKQSREPQPQQTQSQSNWQNTLKKQERQEMLKKVALWGGIIIACIVGLAILVQLASNSGPSTEPVVKENLREVSSSDIVLGNPEAKVVIYEYADFQCPACARYNPIINQILAEYDGQVKVVYRHFPLNSIHPNAQIAGQAGHAAWKLGKFQDMKDMLFDKQNDWANLDDPREVFISYAGQAGMDEAEFAQIMNSDEAKQAVENGEREAVSLGINSTPTFFIGNKQILPTGLETFKELIDAELSGTVTQRPLQ